MGTKKTFAWVLIMVVAIVFSLAIIFPSSLAVLGYSGYAGHTETGEAGQGPAAAAPAAVVESFFAWYLEAYEKEAAGALRNPLMLKEVEGEYLASEYIGRLQDMLADAELELAYDPIFCAGTLPVDMHVVAALKNDSVASVVMGSRLSGHYLTVDLEGIGEDWRITDITCAFSKEGVVKAYYTWYLVYFNDPGREEMAYLNNDFVSEALIAELTESRPQSPILLGDEVPVEFTVRPGASGETVAVALKLADGAVRNLRVSTVIETGYWKISGIETTE